MGETHKEKHKQAKSKIPASVYRFLLHRIEEDKWPVMYCGQFLNKQQVMDIVKKMEERR